MTARDDLARCPGCGHTCCPSKSLECGGDSDAVRRVESLARVLHDSLFDRSGWEHPAHRRNCMDAADAVIREWLPTVLAPIEALADGWEAIECLPGAFYPHALAYANGRESQAESCAAQLRAALRGDV